MPLYAIRPQTVQWFVVASRQVMHSNNTVLVDTYPGYQEFLAEVRTKQASIDFSSPPTPLPTTLVWPLGIC